MLSSVKNLVQKTLNRFDIQIARHSRVLQLEGKVRAADDMELLLGLPIQSSAQFLRTLSRSKSQIRQDLFVLCELNFKTEGFFVEFGATNGVDLSNTYLLEKEFGWTGILAEPAKRWHGALKSNRQCQIETDCVWRESNTTIKFREAEVGELSTIDSFSSSDCNREMRSDAQTYDVTTISLEDLLAKFNAPRRIDYLSIDTEGSEYQILESFDFDKYQFRVITCEHNFAPQREKVLSLLTRNGYVRKHENVSGFDDWYVRVD